MNSGEEIPKPDKEHLCKCTHHLMNHSDEDGRCYYCGCGEYDPAPDESDTQGSDPSV